MCARVKLEAEGGTREYDTEDDLRQEPHSIKLVYKFLCSLCKVK